MLSSHVEIIILPFETLTNTSYSTIVQVQKISNLSIGVDSSIEVGQVFVPVIDKSPQLCFGKGAP